MRKEALYTLRFFENPIQNMRPAVESTTTFGLTEVSRAEVQFSCNEQGKLGHMTKSQKKEV